MENNYCIIMSGGIGSRFWPMSREDHPKQFLDFFGTGRSLLQATYDRFVRFIPAENIYIVTHQRYVEKTREQLPEMDPRQILAEPNRRNTAPCIAYVSYYIQKQNPQANIVVAASDHMIINEELFARSITHALQYASEHNCLLTLGIKPSRPETGYGYIQMGEKVTDEFIKVKTFTEKPDAEMAQVFIDSGEFLWNSGMFVWSVRSITEAFEKYLPDISKLFGARPDVYGTEEENEFIRLAYAFCPNISIDYGIMEKAGNVLVYPTSFGWADLGTWGSLYELYDHDPQMNAVTTETKALFYEASNNLVSIENPETLAVIQGIDDCIITQSKNVLLICKKDHEQRIKSFVMDVGLKYGEKYI